MYVGIPLTGVENFQDAERSPDFQIISRERGNTFDVYVSSGGSPLRHGNTRCPRRFEFIGVQAILCDANRKYFHLHCFIPKRQKAFLFHTGAVKKRTIVTNFN
jgi:hypothetical protein